jgi:hypothetical protein
VRAPPALHFQPLQRLVRLTCATCLQCAVRELPFHTLRAVGLKPGVTESCWLFSNMGGSQGCVKIVNYGEARDSLVKFIVGPRARLTEGCWNEEMTARIQAAITNCPSPPSDLQPTNWEEQHKAKLRMSTLALASQTAPLPVAPPPPMPVSDIWGGFDDSVSEVGSIELFALNGPTIETIDFFKKANLQSYLPAVEGQQNWWDIQDVAETKDLTKLLLDIGMKNVVHLLKFMTHLNADYPVAQGRRYHRLAFRTGPRFPRVKLTAPKPPGFKSAFMIGKYKGNKLKEAQATALVNDPSLGFNKPVLTRAQAAKSPSARALVSRVKDEIKLW